MHDLTKKSFELYNSIGYLDRLHSIYPMNSNEIRQIDPTLCSELKIYFEERDTLNLFNLLLSLDKFPVKDSYKAFFGRCKKYERESIIRANSSTVERICERIYALGFNKMIEAISEPKETNRQIGPMFPNWIRSQYPTYSDFDSFINATDKISVLAASDSSLIAFATRKLGISLPKGTDGKEKGLDLVAKINTSNKPIYVIGEAKFLTDFGGHQNAQLNDALNLILNSEFKYSNNNFDVIRVAILDGVCWIDSSGDKMVKRLKCLNDSQLALSALYLDDLFNSLK